jgi:hypothetical protein
MNYLSREKQRRQRRRWASPTGLGGIAQLVDAALAVAPALPTETPPDRRRKLIVIQGGKA